MTTHRPPSAGILPAGGGREGPRPAADADAPASDPRDLRLPREAFLWAMLEAPVRRAGRAKRAAPLAPGLVPALAEQVHVDPDTLVAVAAPIDDHRLLVCALERDRVEDARAGALTLGPANLPACVLPSPAGPDRSSDPRGAGDSAPLHPARFDLLVGAALPHAARQRARVRHGLGALALTFWSLLLALGLARRAQRWDHAADQARDRALLVATVIDPAAPDLVLADLAYLADQARAASAGAVGLGAPRPVGPALADLVARWPGQAPPTSLRIDERSILATALVPGEPGEFLSALIAPDGWRLREPRLSALDDRTQITLVFERVAAAALEPLAPLAPGGPDHDTAIARAGASVPRSSAHQPEGTP